MSTAATRPPSEEELDQFDRSTKKKKGGDHAFTGDASGPVHYDDIYEEVNDDADEQVQGRRTYKETMLGVSDEALRGDGNDKAGGTHEHGEFHIGPMNLQIVEKKVGGYDCPEIVIPPHAEARLCRPWKQGLIVKLLGRHIGFKALENRLNQLWVQKGVLNVMDLGNEFFMVYLSSPEDYEKALSNGPWMIYDHYLTVRPWRPNFRPEKEEIGHVTVWVRLPELPVEYYDLDFLDFLGNRIGRTVKVDQTTEKLTRGKFARVCVEIDLNKPLLAMFEIKGHVYKIEYEGLHLLCMGCGKFGHYKEQCAERREPVVAEGETTVERSASGSGGSSTVAPENGPWKVVQKQRWPRKGKDKGGPVTGGGRQTLAHINDNAIAKSSRFGVLEVNEENHEVVNEVRENQGDTTHDSRQANQVAPTKKQVNKPKVAPSRNIGVKTNNVEIKEKEVVSSQPHVQQQGIFGNSRHNKGDMQENGADLMVMDHQGMGDASQPRHTGPTQNLRLEATQVNSLQTGGPSFDPVPLGPNTNTTGPMLFHTTRPPDDGQGASYTPKISNNPEDVGMIDSDEYVDAYEQGDNRSEGEMEVVMETPLV